MVSIDKNGKFLSRVTVAEHYKLTEINDAFDNVLRIVGLGISFMHCKNVVQTQAPIANGKRWHKQHKQPEIKFRTLNIEPMKTVLRTEGGSETNGIKKALHICRGHFATYTEEKPLFGRLVGQFWKPSHTRGNIKHGAVVKDYSVK
jgi:hypothetical protein